MEILGHNVRQPAETLRDARAARGERQYLGVRLPPLSAAPALRVEGLPYEVLTRDRLVQFLDNAKSLDDARRKSAEKNRAAAMSGQDGQLLATPTQGVTWNYTDRVARHSYDHWLVYAVPAQQLMLTEPQLEQKIQVMRNFLTVVHAANEMRWGILLAVPCEPLEPDGKSGAQRFEPLCGDLLREQLRYGVRDFEGRGIVFGRSPVFLLPITLDGKLQCSLGGVGEVLAGRTLHLGGGPVAPALTTIASEIGAGPRYQVMPHTCVAGNGEFPEIDAATAPASPWNSDHTSVRDAALKQELHGLSLTIKRLSAEAGNGKPAQHQFAA